MQAAPRRAEQPRARAFPNGTLPRAKDLEGLTSWGVRPFLVAYDYRTIWMNREAIQAFGITRKTDKVIFAEKLEKDPRTGEPTGIVTGFGSTGLSEDAEAELRKHLPSHADGQVERGVQWNMNQAVKAGITTVVDPLADMIRRTIARGWKLRNNLLTLRWNRDL